jgi:hypothetical protein
MLDIIAKHKAFGGGIRMNQDGERENTTVIPCFNRSIRIDFRGARISYDTGLSPAWKGRNGVFRVQNGGPEGFW